MSRLRIAPIIEGHGEDNAIRILLERVWYELFEGEYLEVLKPIRSKRQKLVRNPSELDRTINLAVLNLQEKRTEDPEMVLILLDADRDLPCTLGPGLLKEARLHRSDVDLSCVVATIDYESWFVAAAASLSEHLDLTESETNLNPEADRLGKGWIKQRIRRAKYSETVDQPRLTKAMDLALCRAKSSSFDKLCRELKARLKRAS